MFYQGASGGKAEVFEVGKVTGLSAGPIKIMRDNVQNFGEVNMRTAIAANAFEAQQAYGHNAQHFIIVPYTFSIVGLTANLDKLKDKTIVIQWEYTLNGVIQTVEVDSNFLRTAGVYDTVPNIGTNLGSAINAQFLNQYSNAIGSSLFLARRGKVYNIVVNSAIASEGFGATAFLVYKRRHDQLLISAYSQSVRVPNVAAYNLKVFYKDMVDAPAFATGTDRRLEFTITSGEILAYTTVAGGNTGPGVLHINNFSMTKN